MPAKARADQDDRESARRVQPRDLRAAAVAAASLRRPRELRGAARRGAAWRGAAPARPGGTACRKAKCGARAAHSRLGPPRKLPACAAPRRAAPTVLDCCYAGGLGRQYSRLPKTTCGQSARRNRRLEAVKERDEEPEGPCERFGLNRKGLRRCPVCSEERGTPVTAAAENVQLPSADDGDLPPQANESLQQDIRNDFLKTHEETFQETPLPHSYIKRLDVRRRREESWGGGSVEASEQLPKEECWRSFSVEGGAA
ncbi:Protein of unknown function [Gryllus bimaculatus]|nr:Protein of unknown function [Gryllus bimaculatus]